MIRSIYFYLLLIFMQWIVLSKETDTITVEMNTDNTMNKQSRSVPSLRKLLNEMLYISKFDLTNGTYERSIPKEYLNDYKKLNEKRRLEIKENMQWAWSQYQSKCLGSDEIRPISGECHDFWGGMGMMVVESIDSLWIMGLKKEYQQARDWIDQKLSYDLDHFTSVFETIIRAVGGLLSAYGLSGDELFKQKAVDLADRLLRSKNGVFPKPNVHLNSGEVRDYENIAFLSEIGSNVVEFEYLSQITGDSKYKDFSDSILHKLYKQNKENGLLPIKYDVDSGNVRSLEYSISNRADSFYEYLLKGWLLRNKKDKKLQKAYCDALEGTEKHLIKYSMNDRIPYLSDYNTRRSTNIMHHLACFFPGLLTLGASENICGTKNRDLKIAYQLVSTCYLMYNTTRTGLAAEMYHFDMDLMTEERKNSKTTEELHGIHEKPPKTDFEDMQTHIMNKYLLRPETIESLYIMYVKTGNPVFREWGWKIWSSIKRYCKRNYGFADMHNVNEVRSGNDDRGETFFYSETMKYLYLLFSEDGVNYVENYVFNTEAHPIPLKKE